MRETQRALASNVGTQRVRQYLDFLDRALLVRLVRPLELHADGKVVAVLPSLEARYTGVPGSLAASDELSDGAVALNRNGPVPHGHRRGMSDSAARGVACHGDSTIPH